jgi:hypothetical protein
VIFNFSQIEGNKVEPTKFKARVKEWLQKYPEKYQKVEVVLDTCKSKGKETLLLLPVYRHLSSSAVLEMHQFLSKFS